MGRLAPEAREQLVADRRQLVLDAALSLVAERGVTDLTMDQIARRAGLAKGTVYLYFPTKEALLSSLVEAQCVLPELDALVERLAETESLEATMRLAVPVLWRALCTRKQGMVLLLHGGGGQVDYGKLFLECVLPFSQALTAKLSEQLPPDRKAQLDPFFAVRGLLALLLGLFVEHEILGGGKLLPMSEQQITDTVCQMFLRGVQGCGPDHKGDPS